MKQLVRFIAVFTLIVAFSFAGFSQMYLKKILERGELRVGMTAKQPPFSMKAKDGSIIGYEVELAKMLAKGMEVQLKIVEIPFSDLLTSLAEDKIDMVMSGMTMNIKRNTITVFVGPYMISGKSILSRSAAYAKTDDAEDLNDKSEKIVVLKGSTSETYVRKEMPEVALTLAEDYDECIKLLQEGTVNIMVADYPICAYTVQVHPEKGLITLNQPLTIEPIGVALPPDAAHFNNLVENFLNSLLITGVLDDMQTYWFDSGEWISAVKVD